MKKYYNNPNVAVVNLLGQSVMQLEMGSGSDMTGDGVISDAPGRNPLNGQIDLN